MEKSHLKPSKSVKIAHLLTIPPLVMPLRTRQTTIWYGKPQKRAPLANQP